MILSSAYKDVAPAFTVTIPADVNVAFNATKTDKNGNFVFADVEPIETEYLFGYKPRFLGSKRLAFLGII